MLSYVEATASWLLKNQRGRDGKAFSKGAAFAGIEPTISIMSPDCGASGSILSPEYMAGGGGSREGEGAGTATAAMLPRFPALKWEFADDDDKVREWLVISEDPDAPLPTPICHGLYMGIPAAQRSLENADFASAEDVAKPTLLKGGFYYGVNRRNLIYIPPRPLLNHGIHRYFFTVIALSEPLEKTLIESKPTREQIAEAIQDKVLAWGQWMGKCERKL